MKKRILLMALTVTAVALILFPVIQNLRAQEPGEFPPSGEHPVRGRFREEFAKRNARLVDVDEAKKWLERAREYKKEIDALAQQLPSAEEEVRRLSRQFRGAGSDEEKEQIRAELREAVDRQSRIELEMAEKRREFSEENHKIALERYIQAEVEYRDIMRKIEWRRRFMERHFKDPKFRGMHERRPGRRSPPEDPTDDDSR